MSIVNENFREDEESGLWLPKPTGKICLQIAMKEMMILVEGDDPKDQWTQIRDWLMVNDPADLDYLEFTDPRFNNSILVSAQQLRTIRTINFHWIDLEQEKFQREQMDLQFRQARMAAKGSSKLSR